MFRTVPIEKTKWTLHSGRLEMRLGFDRLIQLTHLVHQGRRKKGGGKVHTYGCADSRGVYWGFSVVQSRASEVTGYGRKVRDGLGSEYFSPVLCVSQKCSIPFPRRKKRAPRDIVENNEQVKKGNFMWPRDVNSTCSE